MEFNKCCRCGCFYVSDGDVCPNCSSKDNFEYSTFKSYIEENGLSSSLDSISNEIGISVKNLNRYLKNDELKEYKEEILKNNNCGL